MARWSVTDFVIDASAVVELFVGAAPDRQLRHHALTGAGSTPELLDLEALHAIRRLVRSGALPDVEGAATVRRVQDAPIGRVSHRSLLTRIWQLRDSITAYDAAYIALAEQLGVPLLTCDAHLGRAHGHNAEVIVYPRS
jgi:predicted nucleic acid-binding protein